MANESFHGVELVHALTETASRVHDSRTVKEVIDVAAQGLERLGFLVTIAQVEADLVRVRYVSRPALAWLEASVAALPGGLKVPAALRQVLDGQTVLLPHPIELMPLGDSLPATELRALGARRLLLTPLTILGGAWGALALAHESLAEADVPAVRLFALQVSSTLEVADAQERLAGRTAELKLAHEFAVAGPRADAPALFRRALMTVSTTTQSDAAMLHRYDETTAEFSLVGAPHNYAGLLDTRFARFQMNPSLDIERPRAVPASQLQKREVAFEGFAHVALVPLIIEGKRVGLLSLGRRIDEPYTSSQVTSAEILGLQMASLLERARLYGDSSRLYADLKRSYDELARTQAELVRHERLAALGELAAVMAHEVRNPLGVIFNSLTTLKRLLRPAGDAEMLLNMVGEEADRLNRIVSDLLDFVRPYELARKPIAIEPVITGAIGAATQSLANTTVRVVPDFGGLPPFPADGHLLRQALVNLVVNAMQAMPRGGTVTVRARVEVPETSGACLVIEVEDEGVGLSPRAAERIFQPFFTTKATGTGLGLAVVKRIVDAHQGEVLAKANAAGGTTFLLKLPAGAERDGQVMTPRAFKAVRRVD